MIWAPIGAIGKISRHTFRSIIDGPSYVKMLKNQLLPAARQRCKFRQDNDPKHRSKAAKELLDLEIPKIVDWAPNSPDLNPMENGWSILERHVKKRKPSNIDELETFIHKEWQKVDIHTVKNLTGSMKTN